MKYFLFIILVLFAGFVENAKATVTLSGIITDNMILQRGKPIKIWGNAQPGEKISIQFVNKTSKIKAATDGSWMIQMPAQEAGGPYTLKVSGTNKIIIKNILIGDVWFCSGQSNMVHQLNIHDVTYADEITTANYPEIRQFLIPVLTSLEGPQKDVPKAEWKAAIGEDVRPFSAVAYFFAKKLYEKYHVPIGIVNASVGGTPIEAWTSEEGLNAFAGVTKIITKNKDTAYINSINRRSQTSKSTTPGQQTDKGLAGPIPWYDVNYIPKNWRTINIPGYWEDQGIKNLDGVVWYRKEIDIPAAMTGKSARVFLGRIVDADEFYINGKQVGSTTYQYPQRRYKVPAGLLKPGKNLFVIKVTNSAGKGGFVPDKPYCLFAGNDTIDLKGYWQYKVGEVYERRDRSGFGGGISAQNQPAALYNAMVAPVTNFNIKGFVWYQGESNAGSPGQYEALQKALIADWRNKWRDDKLPFVYVQLPNFMDVNYTPEESNWALLREAQLNALSASNTAMAVAIDLGEWNDIHPDNKKGVGERLALAARKIAYGESIVYSGPVYKSSAIEGNKIILSFEHTGSGMITNDGEAPGAFAIAGADKKFVWANAKLEGDKVIIWSDTIPSPMYTRYAWADNPDGANLYNKEGLPATPFRTDNASR
ncbi:MAG: sialate O-acetylesterase [Bacteroidota bacterium]